MGFATDNLKGIVLIGIGFLANIYGPNFSLVLGLSLSYMVLSLSPSFSIVFSLSTF